MVYNLNSTINATNLLDFAQGTNDIMGGYTIFGYAVLIIVFCVTFITLLQNGYRPATGFAAGTWLCMMLCLLLRPMELISNYALWSCVLLSSISAFTLYMSGNVD
jgi:hypothetical protein